MDERQYRPSGAVGDTSAAVAHARLFICSPHSCEVVKTWFFPRSFGDVNLKKGLRDGNPQVHAVQMARKSRRNSRMQDLKWKALCGRGGEGAGVNRQVRGPIRRRPYNRGEIIAMSRAERSLIAVFIAAFVRRAGCVAANDGLHGRKPGRWQARSGPARQAACH